MAARITGPVIDLRGMARTYPGPPPVPALRPVDLVIEAGDYVAVTGPSGSGKSTLLHLLGLLDVPTEGSYLLDGLDTSALNDRDRSALRGRRIGFVFQAFHLLPYRTALENVLLAELYNRTPRGGRAGAAVAAFRESRFPVGSSQSSRLGRFTSARAIATRWHSPPDSVVGSASSRCPSRTASSASTAARTRAPRGVWL